MATIESDFQEANATYSSPNLNATVAKPTNLAVGDILIAVMGARCTSGDIDGGGGLLSGWTIINESGGFDGSPNTGGRVWAAYIVATAYEVAQPIFTFSWSVGPGSSAAGRVTLFRVSAKNPVLPIGPSNSGGGYSSPTVTSLSFSGITQQYANSLLVIVAMCSEGSGLDSHAVATTNPSWSELFDSANSARLSVAYGTRAPQTATGDASFGIAGSDGAQWQFGVLFEIPPILNATVTPDPVTGAGVVPAPTVTGGANVSPDPATGAGVVNTPTVGQANWSNKDKSSDTGWNNTSKT